MYEVFLLIACFSYYFFKKNNEKKNKSKDLNITVTSAHPGWSATGLMNTSKSSACVYWLLFSVANPLIAQTAHSGSIPLSFAAFSDNAESGEYYGTLKSIVFLSKYCDFQVLFVILIFHLLQVRRHCSVFMVVNQA